MSSSKNRGGGSYLPPHLRKQQGSESTTTAGRSLDEVAPGYLTIRLCHTPDAVALNACPDPVEHVEGAAEGGLRVALLTSPACPSDDMVHELLQWFAAAAEGDAAAVLELPASLTKQERAAWHHAAERLRLHSKSQVSGWGNAWMARTGLRLQQLARCRCARLHTCPATAPSPAFLRSGSTRVPQHPSQHLPHICVLHMPPLCSGVG
jgi:hypothetical protein